MHTVCDNWLHIKLITQGLGSKPEVVYVTLEVTVARCRSIGRIYYMYSFVQIFFCILNDDCFR